MTPSNTGSDLPAAAERPLAEGAARWPGLLPVTIASVVLLLMVARTWEGVAYYTAGHFAYALDDAYIHMAMAKNLALHGVFGATPFEFTSASSSPLWTLLLALAYKVTGVHVLTPLVLTTIAALGLLVCSDLVMRRLGVGGAWRTPGLLWLAAATPLMPIIFGGMEAPLQILIDVAFLYVCVQLIQREDVRWDRLAYGALALAAAATGIRYEGALLILVVVAILAMRRRWALAGAVAGAGAAPIVIYGLVSMSQGAFFLPNPVLIKSADNLSGALLQHGFGAYAAALARQATVYQPYVLLAATLVLLVLQTRAGAPRWSATFLFPAAAAAVSAIHLGFGQTGWFYRYEDYMMVLLGIGVMAQLVQVGPRVLTAAGSTAAVGVLGMVVGLGALGAGIPRAWAAWEATPRASENIYEQMYQTAHFLKANPQYDSVAIGDLGAVAFYNDNLHILDLEGLAERGEPLSSLGRQKSTAKDIAARAEEDGCKIAIVFPEYFDLPSDWVEVARWTISNNLVAYADTVAFLAIPPTDPAVLAADVREYTLTKLPKTVAAQGLPVAPAQ